MGTWSLPPLKKDPTNRRSFGNPLETEGPTWLKTLAVLVQDAGAAAGQPIKLFLFTG